MKFLRNSLVGPLAILLLICVVSFIITMTSKGGQHCIEEVEFRGVNHDEILDWTMARMQGGSALSAVLIRPIKSQERIVTAVCHYKGDSFSLNDIEYIEGDKLAEIKRSSNFYF